MFERLLIAPVGGGSIFETGSIAVSVQRSKNMNNGCSAIDWKASGSIVQVWLAPDSIGNNFQPGFVIDIDARGAPGETQIMVCVRAKQKFPQAPSDPGSGLKAKFETIDIAGTFADRSMLFALLKEEWFPIRRDPAVFRLDIVGGTGIYEGSGGHLTCSFKGICF